MGDRTVSKVRLSFSYPQTLKDKLIALAKADARSLAGYITKILDNKVAQLLGGKNVS